jgi:hypothetical protein
MAQSNKSLQRSAVQFALIQQLARLFYFLPRSLNSGVVRFPVPHLALLFAASQN